MANVLGATGGRPQSDSRPAVPLGSTDNPDNQPIDVLFVGVQNGQPEMDRVEQMFPGQQVNVHVSAYGAGNAPGVADQGSYTVTNYENVDGTNLDGAFGEDGEQLFDAVVWIGPTNNENLAQTSETVGNFVESAGSVLQPGGAVVVVQNLGTPSFRPILQLEGAQLVGQAQLEGREMTHHNQQNLENRNDHVVQFNYDHSGNLIVGDQSAQNAAIDGISNMMGDPLWGENRAYGRGEVLDHIFGYAASDNPFGSGPDAGNSGAPEGPGVSGVTDIAAGGSQPGEGTQESGGMQPLEMGPEGPMDADGFAVPEPGYLGTAFGNAQLHDNFAYLFTGATDLSSDPDTMGRFVVGPMHIPDTHASGHAEANWDGNGGHAGAGASAASVAQTGFGEQDETWWGSLGVGAEAGAGAHANVDHQFGHDNVVSALGGDAQAGAVVDTFGYAGFGNGHHVHFGAKVGASAGAVAGVEGHAYQDNEGAPLQGASGYVGAEAGGALTAEVEGELGAVSGDARVGVMYGFAAGAGFGLGEGPDGKFHIQGSAKFSFVGGATVGFDFAFDQHEFKSEVNALIEGGKSAWEAGKTVLSGYMHDGLAALGITGHEDAVDQAVETVMTEQEWNMFYNTHFVNQGAQPGAIE